MMTTNLFVISNMKQLRTGGSFRILLPFFKHLRVLGVLNSAIFNSFHNRVELGTILEGLRNFAGGGLTPQPPPPPPPQETPPPHTTNPHFFLGPFIISRVSKVF